MVLWNSASESLSLLLEEAGPEGEVVENLEEVAEGEVGIEDLGATRPCIGTLESFRLRRLIAQMVLRNQCKMPKDLILILRDASSNRAMLSFWHFHLLAFNPTLSQSTSTVPQSQTQIAFNPRYRIDRLLEAFPTTRKKISEPGHCRYAGRHE